MQKFLAIFLFFTNWILAQNKDFYYYSMQYDYENLTTNFALKSVNQLVSEVNFDYGIISVLIFNADTLSNIYHLQLELYRQDLLKADLILTNTVEPLYAPYCAFRLLPEQGLIVSWQADYIMGVPNLTFYDDSISAFYSWGGGVNKEFFCVYSLYPDLQQKTPIATVMSFIDALNIQDFRKAYSFQKVPAWGDYQHFSSTKGFGGITAVDVDTIFLISQTQNQAQVFVSAKYYDTANYNLKIDEIFYLQKIDDKWFIKKLSVKKLLGFGNYYGNGELYITDLTSKSFNFELYFAIGDYLSENVPGGYAIGTANKIGKDKFVYKKDDCKIYFKFANRKHKVIISENNKCDSLRHQKIRFMGVFQISH